MLRYAWDKKNLPKLFWDNELGKIINIYVFNDIF